MFLLGHSYGAHTALAAASQVADLVRKLVLYEPPCPPVAAKKTLARLEELASGGNWDGFSVTFFRDLLLIPSAAVIPDVRIQELSGQAHEGVPTAPEMYAEAVVRLLLFP